jgi:hypothetical protein
MGVYKASCCCGALSLEAVGEPALNAICHCDNCKRRTGTAFGWSCYFREGEVTTSGEARVYAFDSASGRQARSFCPTCGSTLFWRSAVFAGMIGIAGGALATNGVAEPTTSASEAGRCAWLSLPETWRRWP